MMSPGDIGPSTMKDPLSLFGYLVEKGGKVLLTTEELRETLSGLGYSIEEERKDLRLMGGQIESIDAVWWARANEKYSIEDLFRILQSVFRVLKPKKGILVLSFLKQSKENEWVVRTVMTLLRQTGFQLFHSFESDDEYLYFCQRI